MSQFTITSEVASINAGFLTNPVQLRLVAVPNADAADRYFACCSSNEDLPRLLVDSRFKGPFGSLKKAMRRTDILKTLKDMKDAEWHTRRERHAKRPWSAGRYTLMQNRAKVLAFPSVIDIVAPSVGSVEGIPLRVQLAHAGHGLVVKLTPAVLDYLRAAMTEQLEHGGCSTAVHVRTKMDPDDRVDTGVTNLSWSYKRKKYRAIFKPTAEDGTRAKRQHLMTECRASAIKFIETGERPATASVEDGTSEKAATLDEDVPPSSDASGAEDGDDRIPSDGDGRSDPEAFDAGDFDEAAR